MATSVIMPQLGESVVDGTIVKWLKQEGDQVQEYESLLEVETAKVTTEIPSSASGILLKILVPEGQTVLAKTILAWIGAPGEQIPSVNDPSNPAPIANKTVQTAAPSPTSGRSESLGFISPVVARLAGENNIDLTKITGTGDGGRITKKDVLNYIENQSSSTVVTPDLPPWETPGTGDLFKPTELLIPAQPAVRAQPPSALHAKDNPTGDVIIPLSSTRKAIADHMVMSKHTAAHVTTVMEADLSRVAEHRSKEISQGRNLTWTPYFVSAVCTALRQFPVLNSSWADRGIIQHPSIHIGIAVSLGESGLIVPVIKDADGLSLSGLSRAITDLADRARQHQLKPDEVTGGTFSITNHGMGRSLFATPIINQPQCAILGVGAIQKRPIVIQDAIAIRQMVYLSLTFDHRMIDGSTADAFLGSVVNTLENWG